MPCNDLRNNERKSMNQFHDKAIIYYSRVIVVGAGKENIFKEVTEIDTFNVLVVACTAQSQLEYYSVPYSLP